MSPITTVVRDTQISDSFIGSGATLIFTYLSS